MACFPPCHPQQPALSIRFPYPKWPLYRYICDGNTRHLLKNCSTVHEIVTAYLLEVESPQTSWQGLYMWGTFSRTTAVPQGVRCPAMPYCPLTQLLLGAQGVEARLGDDLTEELQKHVLWGALHVGLVVYLNAAVIVDFIPLLIHKPSS